MESLPLSHVKHVNIKEMKEAGIIIRADCLAIKYLIYAGSLANTKYMRIEKDINATVINVAKEILNKVFIINPLRTTYPKIGSIGLVTMYSLRYDTGF